MAISVLVSFMLQSPTSLLAAGFAPQLPQVWLRWSIVKTVLPLKKKGLLVEEGKLYVIAFIIRKVIFWREHYYFGPVTTRDTVLGMMYTFLLNIYTACKHMFCRA